jgi:hypothetical protein
MVFKYALVVKRNLGGLDPIWDRVMVNSLGILDLKTSPLYVWLYYLFNSISILMYTGMPRPNHEPTSELIVIHCIKRTFIFKREHSASIRDGWLVGWLVGLLVGRLVG